MVLFPIIKQSTRHSPEFLGNGFFISQCGLFVTATHVIEEILQRHDPLVFLGNSEPPSWDIIPEYGLCLYHNDEQKHITSIFPKQRENRFIDICVGTTSCNNINCLAPTFFWHPEPGTTIKSMRFDGDQFNFNENNSTVSYAYSETSGIFCDICHDRRKAGLPYCRVEMNIQPGHSGSPVFDEDGNIWAVCSQSDEGDTNHGWITPLLETRNIHIPKTIAPEYNDCTVEVLIQNDTIIDSSEQQRGNNAAIENLHT